jgi:hypothetical protein
MLLCNVSWVGVVLQNASLAAANEHVKDLEKKVVHDVDHLQRQCETQAKLCSLYKVCALQAPPRVVQSMGGGCPLPSHPPPLQTHLDRCLYHTALTGFPHTALATALPLCVNVSPPPLPSPPHHHPSSAHTA